ncbi:MAG: arylsulfotransferase family protein [Solirubrobacteraceae bacterium]
MTDPRPIPTPPPPASWARWPLSRRGFLALAGGTGASLALSACGGVFGSKTVTDVTEEIAPATFQSDPKLRPPVIVVARRPADPGDERFVVTEAHGRGQQGPMILDRAGRLRWFLPVSDHGDPHRRAMNVRVQRYRGRRVITFWLGRLVENHGAGHYEIYDERYRKIAEVHAADGMKGDLHEFVITPQDTALFTTFGVAHGEIPSRHGGLRRGPYWYCCCQEVDIASGRLLLQWRSDANVPFSASHHGLPHRHRTPWDYFHMNSITVDPVDNNLIISSRNLWQVYKIARSTGETIWRLGGEGSDFELEPRAKFAWQHHVTAHHHGIYTIFDNEAGPPREASQSRALVVRVDEERRTVRFVREYHHVPPVLAPALGSMQALDDGGVFVGWGKPSWFTEWDRDGAVVLDAHLADGVSYRAFQQPWRGVPDAPPKFVVRRTGGRAVLYVSWNGATVHRRWRVLGGGSSGTLSELAIADVGGFETVIALDHVPAWVKLEAVGSRGDVVGHSDVVRLA